MFDNEGSMGEGGEFEQQDRNEQQKGSSGIIFLDGFHFKKIQ